MDKVLLHCDLNNFYASVEALMHPEYADKPIAVAGDPKKRTGIILAKNYIAKKYGISTGEVIWKAKQKCPDLICLAPHHDNYQKYSKIVQQIYLRFTDKVEPFGLDECWLDVTNSQKLFGTGREIADKIRQIVKAETSLTISVGVSFSKMFAKLGSDLKKPDATTEITKENYKKIVWPLPINDLMFIGRHRQIDLQKMNINTIGELAVMDEKILKSKFGINGPYLKQIANGAEPDAVANFLDLAQVKSIGNGTTAIADIFTMEEAKQIIYHLSEMTAFRLREKNFECYCITLSIKDNNLETISKAKTIPNRTASPKEIASVSIKLLEEIWNFYSDVKIRAIRIKCSTLVSSFDSYQECMFSGNRQKINSRLNSIAKVRSKYGFNSIKRALLIGQKILNIECDEELF